MLNIRRKRSFSTTRWTVVRAAGDPSSSAHGRALEELCANYWYPLYAYVRRQGHTEQAAEDLIQEFFARFIQRDGLQSVAPHKGRFRTFMLVCLKRFLADQWRHDHAQKRGGTRVPTDIELAEQLMGAEAFHTQSPERLYERQWALRLLESVLARLTAEMERAGKAPLLEALLPHLVRDQDRIPQTRIAEQLEMRPGAVRMETLRIRRRFGALLRDEIAMTLADPQGIEEEISEIFGILAS